MSSTILVDAGSVGAKAKFSLGSLRMDQIPTGVIYGFLKEVQHLYEFFGTNDILFFWDSKQSKRRELFPAYKENRTKKTKREKDEWEITYEQYDKLRNDLLPRIGFHNQFLFDGYEADDLLHKTAENFANDYGSSKLIMVTGDEDMYQSLDYCDIYKGKKVVFTRNDFEEKYGIPPSRWAEVKAIAGCTSDKVPGVPGVGTKTAIKYLTGELKRTNKTYSSIISPLGKETIKRNTPLVKLPFDGTPICELEWNVFSLVEFENICEELGMSSLLGQYSLPVWEKMLR